MKLFVSVLCLSLVGGQTITDLTMSDYPTNERGYIIATTSEGIVSPICGRVNLLTAWITCLSVGWLGVTGAGNTGGLGIDGPNVVTHPILLSDLSCTSFSNTGTAAGKEFDCTVSTAVPLVGCTSDNVAAVTCFFSVGQVAGIAAGLVALCLLVIIVSTICCCVCCCCTIGRAARYNLHVPTQEYSKM